MNTVAKGDAFETRVFEYLKKELASGNLGLNPDCCKIFKKKKYYSKEREANIIVDISIEVWLPKANKWSILWVCECKDLANPVPVDDVEEFKAKLNQIAGVNIKGMMVVSGALQRGALNYAKNNGIGVARILPDDQVQHIDYFMTTKVIESEFKLNSIEFNQALTRQQYIGRNRKFYIIADNYLFDGWRSLFKFITKEAEP